MNQKNSLGLDNCFLDTKDPIELFKTWMNKAKETEPNDPNAFSLATSDKHGFPSVRIVLLKAFNKNGFVFYTNLNSPKSLFLKENPKAEMCFYWKSLLRQVRVSGNASLVSDKVADDYYKTRPHAARIGSWASKQSTVLKDKDELINSIKKYKEKYNNEKNVDRPEYWSGWNLTPKNIEFWLEGENRIHERLKYSKDDNGNWNKFLLNP